MPTNITHGLPATCLACSNCTWTRYSDDLMLAAAHAENFNHRVLHITTRIAVIDCPKPETKKAKVSDSE